MLVFVGSWAIVVTLCISSFSDTFVQEAPLSVDLKRPPLTPPASIMFELATSGTIALVLPPKLEGPLFTKLASGALKPSPPSSLIFAFCEFRNSFLFSSCGINPVAGFACNSYSYIDLYSENKALSSGVFLDFLTLVIFSSAMMLLCSF